MSHSPFLIDAQDVSLLLSVSERHVWSLHSAGRLPLPVRLGRTTRWRADELRAWLDAGCPERSRWEQQREGSRP